jgi:hypothetical protein
MPQPMGWCAGRRRTRCDDRERRQHVLVLRVVLRVAQRRAAAQCERTSAEDGRTAHMGDRGNVAEGERSPQVLGTALGGAHRDLRRTAGVGCDRRG